MTHFRPPLRPYDFSRLSVGDYVEARRGSSPDHHGTILEALPGQGVFWIRDEITGLRRMIDFDSFDVWFSRGGDDTQDDGNCPGD